MDSNSIRVKNEVLQDYTCRRNRQNPVHRFWMQILSEMPGHLKEEARTKRTDLVKQDISKSPTQDAVPFQFETLSGSKELAQFLNKYIVLVEEEIQRIKDWEDEMLQGQNNNMYAMALNS